MSKRICAKVGTYTKEGQEKGRYVDIGVVLSNQNGEYILLDPTVNLAGVMMKQRLMSGKGDSVMCSIFDNSQQQAPQQQAPQGQPAGQGFNQFDDPPF